MSRQCQKGREGEEGNQSNAEKSSTNLLLWILHSSHGCRGSALHSHGIALGAGRAVGLPGVGAALLRLRVRVIAHAVQLRSLHDHWIHWTALLLNTSKEILLRYGKKKVGIVMLTAGKLYTFSQCFIHRILT